jgi:hypothetical protein
MSSVSGAAHARRMVASRLTIALTIGVALGARGCKAKANVEVVDAAPAPSVTASASSPAAPSVPPSAIPSAIPAPRAVVSIDNADAGAGGCKLLRGPLAQPFNGPSTLRMVERAEGPLAELVVNAGGAPRFYDILPGDAGAPPQVVPPKSTLPPCAAARDVVFCPDASGAIHRSHGAGEGDTVVGQSRAGTEVSAAMLGGHALVAFIAERVTSDGLLREAWLATDDGAPPLRLSEEGSGTTFVELAARGDAVVAMMIDARTAMTPTHARIVTLEAGKPKVGPDAVIFVGGSAERHNAGALATSKEGTVFGLVAVADGASRFGMAAIAIDDPPAVDAPVAWSLYPNGLDPAAIAATRGGARMHVARVRPKTADPASLHVLELGYLQTSGAFRARCTIAEATFVKDVEVESDRQGALWVFYREPGGTRLARIGDAAAR